MNKPASLALMQGFFADALLDSSKEVQAASLFLNAAGGVRDRLALYRGNLTSIWRQALANAYPVILQLVGEDYFERLAREYGRMYPSTEGDLNVFGSHLADYFAQDEVAHRYPYFPEVAALEWRLHQSYYAKDATAISLIELVTAAQASAVDVQFAHLTFCPACCLFQSGTAAVEVWMAHQADTAQWPVQLNIPSFAVVFRRNWHAQAQALTMAAYQALQSLASGATLGDAFEVALELDPQFDVAGNLQAWFALGLFCSVRFDGVQ